MADKRNAGRRAGGDPAHLPLRVLRRRWASRAANASGTDATPPAGVATGPVLPVHAEPARSIGPDPLGGPPPAPPGPPRPAPPEPDHAVPERPVAEPPAWAGGHDPLQRRHPPAPLTARRPAGIDVTAPRASGLTPLPHRRAGEADGSDGGPGSGPVAADEGTIDDINALMDFLRRDDP